PPGARRSCLKTWLSGVTAAQPLRCQPFAWEDAWDGPIWVAHHYFGIAAMYTYNVANCQYRPTLSTQHHRIDEGKRLRFASGARAFWPYAACRERKAIGFVTFEGAR